MNRTITTIKDSLEAAATLIIPIKDRTKQTLITNCDYCNFPFNLYYGFSELILNSTKTLFFPNCILKKEFSCPSATVLRFGGLGDFS